MHLSASWLLADNPQGGNPYGLLPGLAAVAVVFYFMMVLPEKRKAKSHRAALDQLKKNDRVVTVGGIYGTVTNIQRDADEVTLKVDEATNAKLRVTFNAISRVIGDTPADEKSTKS